MINRVPDCRTGHLLQSGSGPVVHGAALGDLGSRQASAAVGSGPTGGGPVCLYEPGPGGPRNTTFSWRARKPSSCRLSISASTVRALARAADDRAQCAMRLSWRGSPREAWNSASMAGGSNRGSSQPARRRRWAMAPDGTPTPSSARWHPQEWVSHLPLPLPARADPQSPTRQTLCADTRPRRLLLKTQRWPPRCRGPRPSRAWRVS